MNQYRPTIGIEPIDKYEKARTDLIAALKSFSELSPNQKRSLANELFGAAYVDAVLRLAQRRNNGNY